MRRFFKELVTSVMIVVMLFAATFSAAAISDNGLWEDSTYCPILDADEESNSDLCFAAVKVRYDRSINRIYLLFTLEFDEFNDVNSCGVMMNFNGMGNIKVMCDGTAEFNNSVYFAELEDKLFDSHSKNVLIETTVGIKSGIPENVIMNLNVIDTNGIKSNLYEVDITEEDIDPEDDPGDTTPEKTAKEKTTKVKTTKVKTTKVKTTKRKTTKVKSTKVKTTKAKKSKTSKTVSGDEEDAEDEQVVVESGIDGNVEIDNKRKKIMLALGAGAALVAIAAGCAAGMKNRKKDKDKDGGHE